MTKNRKKFTAEKKLNFLLDQKLQYTIPKPPYRKSKLQKKHSTLKREHPALQKLKFLNFFYFCGSFLPSWIRMDPDYEYGSGSTDLIESGSNMDPDPKAWLVGLTLVGWPPSSVSAMRLRRHEVLLAPSAIAVVLIA
jgi:hypothetical protein